MYNLVTILDQVVCRSRVLFTTDLLTLILVNSFRTETPPMLSFQANSATVQSSMQNLPKVCHYFPTIHKLVAILDQCLLKDCPFLRRHLKNQALEHHPHCSPKGQLKDLMFKIKHQLQQEWKTKDQLKINQRTL